MDTLPTIECVLFDRDQNRLITQWYFIESGTVHRDIIQSLTAFTRITLEGDPIPNDNETFPNYQDRLTIGRFVDQLDNGIILCGSGTEFHYFKLRAISKYSII